MMMEVVLKEEEPMIYQTVYEDDNIGDNITDEDIEII